MTAGGVAGGRWPLSQMIERRLVRLFAAISTIYGFWIVFDMDEYLPWQVRLFRAVKMTFICHLGLWLATFEWQGRFRFLVAALVLLSMVGLLFLWWSAGIVVFGWLGWRLFQLLKGKLRESQPA